MEYDFVLKFKLPKRNADASDLVERLGEAGCNDAVVGIGQPDRITLNFTRDADSAQQAILSAREEVARALPNAVLIEVSPEMPGVTGSQSSSTRRSR